MTLHSRRDLLRAAASLGAGAAASSALPFAGCARAPAAPALAALAPPQSITGAGSLGAHGAAHNLLYGCAVDVNALTTDPAYATLLREQCRIVVAENAMKWAALRPTADAFRFEQADALVAFAEANRMKIRGHNLVWHIYNPRWFDAFATAANARQLLTTHIQTVAGRYAGRMHSWDVVNEAIEPRDGRADGMRNSPWLRLVGDDYIELAFRTARDADPQALLTYNDYGIESETPEAERKRQAVLTMLRRMVARRIPVDAVGIQSHISANASPAQAASTPAAPGAVSPSMNNAATPPGPTYGPGIVRFIADARELGLQVFLTELDVNDRALPADIPLRDAAVAATYKQYLDLVLADPAVRAVLTWGIADRYTWLNHEDARTDGQPERPLPFDPEYGAAPAFFATRNAFDTRRGISAIYINYPDLQRIQSAP
jgi:endo-1,4-beta-xylanase